MSIYASRKTLPKRIDFFNREKTLKLLELYQKYKSKLGSFEVKFLKKLWELVARDISNEFRITIAANKCENCFKVLQRNYKKVVDNNNQTGRGRKVFEYEKEMDEIFEGRRNIHPVVLLSSNNEVVTNKASNEDPVEISVLNIEPMPSCSHSITEIESGDHNPQDSVTANEPNVMKKNLSRKRKRTKSPAYKKRNDILLEIKNDLKSFYDRKK
ncbi:hypothetical protein NQ314_013181 [Rhamnusium bicolor]|uniref:Myb/SANT-like DNA-binding domain-containing protein n=1 Tax=Rhamnusium bicolor TaxID=1586634 RepID=A0AAV8X7N7_9CUCU|nr:hypothetical protein NQ314_013181 [Rhamnusium bicolor]